MRALILDRKHDVRVVEVPATTDRPLLDVEAAVADLPPPAGSRPSKDGGRDFVFVTKHVDGGVPLRALDDAAWQLYCQLMLGGYEPPTRAVDVWSFGDGEEMSARLIHLVAHGEKRVTMGWLDGNDGDGIPNAYGGGISIVTDSFGYPWLVLRTVSVDVKPFSAVTPEDAAGEGEGDLTHADWREGHVAYFTRQSARTGIPFDDTARIAVERFEVLQIL